MSKKNLHFEPSQIAFEKDNNFCFEAFVLAFKPINLQNMVLSYFRNNSVHFFGGEREGFVYVILEAI